MAKSLENAKIELELVKLNQPSNVGKYNKLFNIVNSCLREAKEAEREYHELFMKSYTIRKQYLEQYNSTMQKLATAEEEIVEFITTALKNYVTYQTQRLESQKEEINININVIYMSLYLILLETGKEKKI